MRNYSKKTVGNWGYRYARKLTWNRKGFRVLGFRVWGLSLGPLETTVASKKSVIELSAASGKV